MTKLSPTKLQAALDSLAAANNRAKIARDKIMDHCNEVYGFEPGDIDFDHFIDACDGGSGSCTSMSVEEFEMGMLAGMSDKLRRT
jgi:hypothetical protein